MTEKEKLLYQPYTCQLLGAKDYFSQLCFGLTNSWEKFSFPVTECSLLSVFSRVHVCCYDVMHSIENILQNLKNSKM